MSTYADPATLSTQPAPETETALPTPAGPSPALVFPDVAEAARTTREAARAAIWHGLTVVRYGTAADGGRYTPDIRVVGTREVAEEDPEWTAATSWTHDPYTAPDPVRQWLGNDGEWYGYADLPRRLELLDEPLDLPTCQAPECEHFGDKYGCKHNRLRGPLGGGSVEDERGECADPAGPVLSVVEEAVAAVGLDSTVAALPAGGVELRYRRRLTGPAQVAALLDKLSSAGVELVSQRPLGDLRVMVFTSPEPECGASRG